MTSTCLRVAFRVALLDTDLVTRQDLEGLHDLLSSVRVSCLSRHEVQEGVKSHIACAVGVHDGHDALEVSLTLTTHNKALTLATTHCDELLTSPPTHYSKVLTLEANTLQPGADIITSNTPSQGIDTGSNTLKQGINTDINALRDNPLTLATLLWNKDLTLPTTHQPPQWNSH